MGVLLLVALESVGVWPYGSFTAVAPDSPGTLLFVGSGAGVWAMKEDGETWRRIGEIRTIGGGVRDLRYDEASRKLFVLSSTFQIWDVADPTAPGFLGHLTLPREALRLDIAGHHAFLAMGESGMRVVDVSGPSAPAVVGTYDAGDRVVDLDVQDSLAVLLVGSFQPLATLHLVNVSDPANPLHIGTWTYPGWGDRGITAFALKDTFLLVLAGESLFVLSVAEPSMPVLLNSLPLTFATHLALSGDTAYAVGGEYPGWLDAWGSIWVLDLSGLPAVTVLDSLVSTQGILLLPHRLAAAGGRAFVITWDPEDQTAIGGGDRDLWILEGTQPVAMVSSPGWGVLDVMPLGAKGWISTGGEGLFIMDFSTPAWPAVNRLWLNSHGGNVFDLSLHGDWLFGILGEFDWDRGFTRRLVVWNITDSVGRPGWSFDPGPLYLQGYALNGDSLFVIVRGDSLLVFDVGGAFSLQAQATLPFPGRSIAVRDTLAVVTAGTTGVGVLNFRDVENPELLSVIHTAGEARQVALLGELLYVADGIGGLQVYSLAHPPVPIKVAHLPVRADGLDLVPPHGVVWAYTGHLYLLNLSDPAHPAVAGAYETSGTILRARLKPPYIFLARRSLGLEILRFSGTGVVERPPRVHLVRRGTRLPRGRLFDLLGRSVRPSRSIPPGAYILKTETLSSRRVQILP